MKKLFALFATILISLSAQATTFKEGVDYKVLDRPHSEQPVVNEFFSFYCPHCFQFEHYIEQLKQHFLGKAIFTRSHVSFLGGDMGENMTKAYATMVSLNVEDKLIPAMFNQIQVKREPPLDIEELKQIFTAHGVSTEDFNDAFNSFAVDSMARKFDKDFMDSGLRGVPSVVVNNKYLITLKPNRNMTSVDSFFQIYTELVEYLLKK
ncbi:thiol:disulfide interchange protein DsbA/DsbL [Vibrio salinus]|uniref:thiol:disulfide interchange protein DsbA/DsbL n=1 Tax=Vibrio salinus TaxID=2899784 RepID=UPI001E5A1B58|nr:thiol:disulfide interchange protein DsbA/DsbL [Vibrio salinus]MCE0493666.1 thiol:disulfide interchange protein DsbA/DsbL [Vibrio salinus]